MDTLNWEATPIIRSASSSWKNQQQQIEDSLMMPNSNRFPPNAFNPIQQHDSYQCRDIGDSSSSLAMNLQEFGAVFDPIHILSSWKISQRQEAATKLAADSVSAKSGAGSIGDCCKMGSSFPPQNNYNVPYFVNNQLAVFGSNDFLSKSRSFDCLLSATNTSNTDTSVEDDGISMIFSDDSKSLWNINTDKAVSSGESAIDAFNLKSIDANDSNNIKCPVNELDETVSHIPSYHPRNNPIRSLYTAKRSHDHALLEPDSSIKDSGFQLIPENDQPKSKKPRSENKLPNSSNINFQQASSSACSVDEPDSEAIAQMKEVIYRAAAFRPVSTVTEVEVETKPKRKNVRISTDPQTAAARRRRERISERIRALQKLVPGGSNMDTASMLDEAANYLKFLRTQVNALEASGYKLDPVIINNNFSYLSSIPFNYPFPMQPHFPPLNLNPIQRVDI